jgi:hypothetical protein
MMDIHQDTPEHAARWQAWQRGNVISAQRSHRHALAAGAVMLGGMFIWMVIALWP